MAWPKGKPRPAGAGRKAGTPNKRKTEFHAAVAAYVEEHNADPFHFIARLVADTSAQIEHRLQAAKELAQYLQPKLKAIEHSGGLDHHVTFVEVTLE
jgi:hypothetical protein